MAWTKDQQNAIDARNCNLLVSAAAGSGKTAVLIERILKRVTDEKNPVDIDSIVVVTFTRAAAGEMKARLSKAFEEALKNNPGNRHLIRQIALVDSAQITTIDSFCNNILKNYYNSINMDPDYRLADEGELNLIKEDVLDEIFEERFAKGDENFIDFVEAFAPGKTLNKLSDIILGLHKFSQSNPWPLEWLGDCEKIYDVTTVEEYEELPLVQEIKTYIREICRSCIEDYEYVIECCNGESGPIEYIPVIQSDIDMWETCIKMKTLAGIANVLSRDFENLPKSPNSDGDIRSEIQKIRRTMKSRRDKLLSKFCQDVYTQVEQIRNCRPMAKMYLDLTREFTERFQKYKSDKNIVDFSDVEHYALDILVSRENGASIYTDIADELAHNYTEIYIDEYQDGNQVQEYILTAVSRERFGTPNIFMVGDVKQSIYKFRMAMPELFMEKYDRYKIYDEKCPDIYNKIELHQNFRSRENVLESINDVFYKIMKKSVGGIDYTDEVRLNAGRTFEDEFDDSTELIVLRETELRSEHISKREACAHVTAEKIKQMLKLNPNLTFRDFAVLLRSDKTAGPVYANALASHGIPCVYASSRGYFTANEVSNVLDFLRVIDNPRQEIPLAGLMRSYFSYFDANELALVKGRRRKTELYDCLLQYADKGDELAHKCRDLIELINDYRHRATIYTIRELITRIVYSTGYYDYVGAMPGGKIKKANLDMLVEKAGEYEKTSYSGLFNFLRYIDKLQKYDVDYGEGKTGSEDENLVKIMSIHKSKGLEFPVVIIGDFDKKYNLRDASEPIIYDSSVGIGMDYVNLEYRYKESSVYKNMVGHKIITDSIGEELRVLYVGMTRAVDKLIMIGSATDNTMDKWEKVSGNSLETSYIMETTNYLSLIVPCALENPRYMVSKVNASTVKSIMQSPVSKLTEAVCFKLDELDNIEIDEERFDRIKAILEYRYPHNNIISIKSKYSVSDLKHAAMEESELLEARIDNAVRDKIIPKFISEEEQEVGGTTRGNAYHKVFELLDYSNATDKESIETQLAGWQKSGKITPEYIKLINPAKFTNFLSTDIGKAMKRAFVNKKLYREQPFIMEVGANAVDKDFPSEEKVLIQGIIDAFFIEDGKVHIVDYKTDRVDTDNGEEVLVARYAKQLELYRDAIAKITGLPVEACHIYSVSLNKDIPIFYSENA